MSEHQTVYSLVGIPEHYAHVAGAGLVTVVLTLAGLKIKSTLKNMDAHILPEPKASWLNISALIVGSWKNLLSSMIGHGAEKFVPVIGTTFLFILFCNLSGLIPGFPPPTDNINTNLALGLITFLVYQVMGFKEHGWHYLKQFTGGLPPAGYGPVLTGFLILVAGLMVVIELVGHAIRPLSLSLRLWGNITGDHTLVGVFMGLIPLGFPILAMALGVFVCFIQSLVFSLLSAVYIKLAVSHDH